MVAIVVVRGRDDGFVVAPVVATMASVVATMVLVVATMVLWSPLWSRPTFWCSRPCICGRDGGCCGGDCGRSNDVRIRAIAYVCN